MRPHLTARDGEVLSELNAACKNYMDVTGNDWVRPLDCGGSNSSDHSYRLAKLARMGLAEQKQRWGSVRMPRGSKVYRITEAGSAALRAREGR